MEGRASTTAAASGKASFETDIPARLDRLPWSRFHWLVVVALGITWILDGLEVTLVGSLGGAIHNSPVLRLTETQIGLSASAYLIGAVLGALFFGRLTDSLGRKKLFTVTLLVYMVATIATGFSWNFWSFAFFRFLTGAGIGGEYAAVNSTIQELIPARRRGVTDLAVNGTFWAGAAFGALGAVVLLDPRVIDPEIGWRLAFGIGGALSLIALFLRRWIPESPRWLMTHGRQHEAERIVGDIEDWVRDNRGPLPAAEHRTIRLTPRTHTSLREVAATMFRTYPERSVLGIVLMACQAFCYNAIFFTYALVLTRFYGIEPNHIGWFMLPFAIGNLMGPLLLGHFFDSIGRRPMITATYALSGILMAATGYAFAQGWLSAWEQTAAWTVIFFFASAAASAAYLTVGESFPLEMRAMGIALFYAFGTGIGGVAGPALFGALIEGGARDNIMWGYMLGAALMLIAAATEWKLGFAAERRSLEDVATPLSRAAE
ncbi:Transporter, MFS superfamily [Roseomonas mucosa]|jgi:MFS family permease|uniref:MFS transporter n=1 Tax=Roseomonas TaxID=125216 RepID=UPI00095BB61F|nr:MULTISPECIES: MFS transporter [Roseomonas]ATR21687.1 MFS transporter [Roseomonas sp. FDAARGOS_362]QDJ08503.1 Transporter, MFS superfamily [Roseomonas mucosa]USQ70190.1 MFS transporter [Roseomonas mucosa]UZO95899.1 Transporter, MFS superfamily [Roseomonas mucosa]GAV36002.1 inner membrane metabolite transport protein YgcS [Roseomonas sp. TAS13]